MSDTKFSKGPWWPEFGEAYNVRAPHGGIVAQIHHLKGLCGMGGRLDANEAAANARLIAAAPELYAALLQAQEYLREFAPESEYNDNETLLKKARGQA